MIVDAIARSSAWLAIAIYVLSLILELRQSNAPTRRVVWALGAICLTAHILWTILVVHHASLHEAYAHTAQKTQAFIGIPVGEGLYVNFAMLGLWSLDAVAWCLAPGWDRFRRKFVWPMHVTFSFLFLNAAIVFASPLGRMFGIAALLVALGAWLYPLSKQPVAPEIDRRR